MERLFLAVDDEHASLAHDLVEGVGHDGVHRRHCFLRNTDLILLVRADLLQHAEDVSVEGVWVSTRLRLLLGCLLLLLLQLCDRRTLDCFLLLVRGNHSCNQYRCQESPQGHLPRFLLAVRGSGAFVSTLTPMTSCSSSSTTAAVGPCFRAN